MIDREATYRLAYHHLGERLQHACASGLYESGSFVVQVLDRRNSPRRFFGQDLKEAVAKAEEFLRAEGWKPTHARLAWEKYGRNDILCLHYGNLRTTVGEITHHDGTYQPLVWTMPSPTWENRRVPDKAECIAKVVRWFTDNSPYHVPDLLETST